MEPEQSVREPPTLGFDTPDAKVSIRANRGTAHTLSGAQDDSGGLVARSCEVLFGLLSRYDRQFSVCSLNGVQTLMLLDARDADTVQSGEVILVGKQVVMTWSFT